MTVNDMLVLVRQRLGDMQKITFSDAELLYCLNNAMDELCEELADQNSPEILKEITVSESEPFDLPDDFISWRGQYPLDYSTDESNKTKVSLIGPSWDGDSPKLKYYANKTHFTKLDDVIPFRTLLQQQNLMKKCVQQIKGGNDDSQGTSQSGGSTRTSQ